MTTIKEFQEWLNRFPEETIIEFAIAEEVNHSYTSYKEVKFLSPDLKDEDWGNGWHFNDFRNNQFTKPDAPHYGKCFLELGDEG